MRRRSRSYLLAALLAVGVAFVAADSAAQAQGQPAADASQAAPTPAPAAQTAQVVANVQAFYDKTTTFSSDFSQEFFVKAHNLRKKSSGHVTFAKPGKMDWQYTQPKDNRVVSDGSVLKVYEAANRQMFEQSVDKSQYPAALSFLIGGGKLDDTFNFELFNGAAMKFPGGQVLVGTPKQPTPAYEKVLFYVDTQTAQVRRVLIVDGQGNRNRFDFENPKVNLPVPDQTFKFTPPPGTQVIRP